MTPLQSLTTGEDLGEYATSPAPAFECLSVLDLFKVGIGPSSSHTVGPMWAALDFVGLLEATGRLDQTANLRIDLLGSLGATGSGHRTDAATLLGLSGLVPNTVTTAQIDATLNAIERDHQLLLGGRHAVPMLDDTIRFRPLTMRPEHPNAMRITAYDSDGQTIATHGYYSVGGGFVMRHDEGDVLTPVPESSADKPSRLPYGFTTGFELLHHCHEAHMGIAEVMLANEKMFRPRHETLAELDTIWQVMQDCVAAGMATDGILPGGLQVRRRARAWHQKLLDCRTDEGGRPDMLSGMEWVNLFALAVNEENAAGNRVVTAPTNGAAGIIPAVMHYFAQFVDDGRERLLPWHVEFLLTAAAIGIIIKSNASISGAEVGCQGEVGSASAMAAAGFAAMLGATPSQVENAAEIGIEHNLGLTCDPIKGLVQVPCIERNAMGAVKSINAARMAMQGDGVHLISLDTAVETMRRTGLDMGSEYKETAQGGLAVAFIDC